MNSIQSAVMVLSILTALTAGAQTPKGGAQAPKAAAPAPKAAVPAPSAAAETPEDSIILKNGTEVSGRILRDSGKGVVIEITNPPGRLEYPYAVIDIVNGMSADRVGDLRKASEAAAPAVERLRGLALLGGVRWASRPAAAVRDSVSASFGQGADGDVLRLTRALKRLDLVPAALDAAAVREACALLWSEQATAQAFPAAGEIALIAEEKEVGQKLEVEQPAEFLAWGVSRDRCLLARELGILLAAQHFGLRPAGLLASVLDDGTVARRAALDGHGALMMAETSAAGQGLDAARAEDLGASERIYPRSRAAEAARAPAILRQARTFPARAGGAYLQTVRAAGGWKGVDRSLAAPPSTTEQVLHPEKLLVRREEAVEVTLPRDAGGTEGWTILAEFTPGEWLLGRLIETWLGGGAASAPAEPEPSVRAAALKAAAGWGGARARISAGESGTVLFLASRWDTPADAEEFFDAVREGWRKRHPGQEVSRGTRSGGGFMASVADALGSSLVVATGPDVFLVEGAPAGRVDALMERLQTSTFRPPPAPAPGVLGETAWAAASAARTAAGAFWAGRAPLPEGLGARVADGALTTEKPALRIALPEGWSWQAGDAASGMLADGADDRRSARLTISLRTVPFALPAASAPSASPTESLAGVIVRRAIASQLGEGATIRNERLPVGDGAPWIAAIGTASGGDSIRWALAAARPAPPGEDGGTRYWIVEASADSASASAVGSEAAGVLRKLP